MAIFATHIIIDMLCPDLKNQYRPQGFPFNLIRRNSMDEEMYNGLHLQDFYTGIGQIGRTAGQIFILKNPDTARFLEMLARRGVSWTDHGDRVEMRYFGDTEDCNGDYTRTLVFGEIDFSIYRDGCGYPIHEEMDYPIFAEFFWVFRLGNAISLPIAEFTNDFDGDEEVDHAPNSESVYFDKHTYEYENLKRDSVRILQNIPTLVLQEIIALRQEEQPQT